MPNCSDTFSLQIIALDSLIYSIPNIFTPNNDGNNDFFGITVNKPTEISVVIVNRWGNELLSTNQNLVEGFSAIWGGTSPQEECIDGTYFYKIVLENENLVKQGFVELRR